MSETGGHDPCVDTTPSLRVFLSHAGEDAAAAKALAESMRNVGASVWIASDDLKIGQSWQEGLEEALEWSTAFAVYVGEHGVERWVLNEVRVAVDRNARDGMYRIIPILGRGSDPSMLPVFLGQFHAMDLRDREPTSEYLKSQLAGIQQAPQLGVQLLQAGDNPFRGLGGFEAQHAHLFFGRESETQRLLDQFAQNRLLVVVGASGSGKSSLVRAGLIPALHRGRFLPADRLPANSWAVAITRPGDHPFRELADALPDLDPGLTTRERIELRETCKNQIASGPYGLRDCVAAMSRPGMRTLLVVDQFEELFTLVGDSSVRRRFVDQLLRAIDGKTANPVHVILVIRADFYAKLWEIPKLPTLVGQSIFNVDSMGREQLREVIECPLRLSGVTLEAGLADAILHDVGTEPGSLPLLEHALEQLWLSGQGSERTHLQYDAIGRVEGALHRHAERVYSQLLERGKHQEELLRRILVRLVRIGDETTDTRRRVVRTQLLELGPANQVMRILELLASERLVTIFGDLQTPGTRREPRTTVELAHEALLSAWSRLRQWLHEDRTSLRTQQRLLIATREWTESGRNPDMLPRQGLVELGRKWLERHGDESTESMRAMLHECQRQERARSELERDAEIGRTEILRRRDSIDAGVLFASLRSWFAESESTVDESQIAEWQERRDHMVARLPGYRVWKERARRDDQDLYDSLSQLVETLEVLEPFGDVPARFREIAEDWSGVCKLESAALEFADPRSKDPRNDHRRWAEARIATMARLPRHRELRTLVHNLLEPGDEARVEQLVTKLEALENGTLGEGRAAKIIHSVEWPEWEAQRRKVLASPESRERWDQCLRSLSDREGQALADAIPVDLPLIPLGRDASSGLWEFVHVLSGEVPRWEGEQESGSVLVEDEMGIVLVLVPGNEFEMGHNEKHRVVVPPFLLGKYPMTRNQWQRLFGGLPPRQTRTSHPVDHISWNECQDLAQHGLRLPSEAEWEYAARAGTETDWWFGDSDRELPEYAWIRRNSEQRVRRVGAKPANAFGLHDVYGNVSELCEDEYHSYEDPGRPDDGSAWVEERKDRRRLTRGGHHSSYGHDCNSIHRDVGWSRTGLRVACSLSEEAREAIFNMQSSDWHRRRAAASAFRRLKSCLNQSTPVSQERIEDFLATVMHESLEEVRRYLGPLISKSKEFRELAQSFLAAEIPFHSKAVIVNELREVGAVDPLVELALRHTLPGLPKLGDSGNLSDYWVLSAARLSTKEGFWQSLEQIPWRELGRHELAESVWNRWGWPFEDPELSEPAKRLATRFATQLAISVCRLQADSLDVFRKTFEKQIHPRILYLSCGVYHEQRWNRIHSWPGELGRRMHWGLRDVPRNIWLQPNQDRVKEQATLAVFEGCTVAASFALAFLWSATALVTHPFGYGLGLPWPLPLYGTFSLPGFLYLVLLIGSVERDWPKPLFFAYLSLLWFLAPTFFLKVLVIAVAVRGIPLVWSQLEFNMPLSLATRGTRRLVSELTRKPNIRRATDDDDDPWGAYWAGW